MRHSRPRRMVCDLIGMSSELLFIATGPALKEHPRGKTLQSFPGNIGGKSAPHPEGGGGGEGANEPQARASDARAGKQRSCTL